ncbi:MAG: RelA/SpoT family protein [Bacteroidaceae bacterium]|nr:RelA/SpoT family protein [Bacteroidaceae bacterium]
MRTNFFTKEEQKRFVFLYKTLLRLTHSFISYEERKKIKAIIISAVQKDNLHRDHFQLNPVIKNIQTAILICQEMNMRKASVLAILLHDLVKCNDLSLATIEESFGKDTATIIHGLVQIDVIYAKNPVSNTENFRNLLLSFAEDMRVILIKIADRTNIMRQIRDTENIEQREQVANEASFLYAPLAHKLGLYSIKSELEDLSLKYTEKEAYYHIKEKLNERKKERDAYIQNFIVPIREKIESLGVPFTIKGRTKSIHSIYQKMKKQNCDVEGVYDLFAIRIVINSEEEKEKLDCWQAYSVITDMYRPNPKRLRDWLSVPKSNGYESLHITVMGPMGKWVEVQIRTKRMDEIAERGLAAHWRYKGVKSETNLDEWLTSVRESLEHNESDDCKLMDQFKMDLYEDEVFVFTPKGDLFKLQKGSTVLDFAFLIHSKLGSKCVGAKINGKNATIRQKLVTGDQIEILTSNAQVPKQGWLSIVTTSKARTKIRQTLKEIASKQSEFAKETLERKLKNHKIEFDDATITRLIKKMGYKTLTHFYQAIAEGVLDINVVIEKYTSLLNKEVEVPEEVSNRSAESFNLQKNESEDELILDSNLKGIDYSLAKCCNPIYGDEIFGFVPINGGVKIHRKNCPNAAELHKRFGYRIIKACWSGQTGKQYITSLHIIGQDDIGILTNITSIISKVKGIDLRSIRVDSNSGMFSGSLCIGMSDSKRLTTLIKKLKEVKGVIKIIRE